MMVASIVCVDKIGLFKFNFFFCHRKGCIMHIEHLTHEKQYTYMYLVFTGSLVGGCKCQLSVKIFSTYQLSVEFSDICQLSFNSFFAICLFLVSSIQTLFTLGQPCLKFLSRCFLLLCDLYILFWISSKHEPRTLCYSEF